MSTSATATPQHRAAQTTSTSQVDLPKQGQPEITQQAPKVWDEDDYILALAHLEQLQDVVTSLRSTIPQVVRSLTRKHESPRELYEDFAKQAVSGNQKLANVKKLWDGGNMRDIRVKVEGSMREHGGRSIDNLPSEYGQGIIRQEVRDMPLWGWLEEAENVRARRNKRDEESGDAPVGEQDDKVVEEFRPQHEHVAVDKEENGSIKVIIKTKDDEQLQFEVFRVTEDNKTTYHVTGPSIPTDASKGRRKLYLAIQRCLSMRPKVGSLMVTLDTLAAYKDLHEAQCDVCKHVVDSEMLVCAVRRGRRVRKDGGEVVQWFAMHEACASNAT